MRICLEKSCLFGLPCMSFVNFYQFVCASFSFSFEVCDCTIGWPLYIFYLYMNKPDLGFKSIN